MRLFIQIYFGLSVAEAILLIKSRTHQFLEQPFNDRWRCGQHVGLVIGGLTVMCDFELNLEPRCVL